MILFIITWEIRSSRVIIENKEELQKEIIHIFAYLILKMQKLLLSIDVQE